MKKISTIQIGDGKLPNKYWVSISNDYYYNNDNCYNWISEKTKKFKFEGKTLKVFNTYKEAKAFFDSISIGASCGKIEVKSKSIEDRFTGQLTEEVYIEREICPCCKREKNTEEIFYNEDLKFTQKKMEELGTEFI